MVLVLVPAPLPGVAAPLLVALAVSSTLIFLFINNAAIDRVCVWCVGGWGSGSHAGLRSCITATGRALELQLTGRVSSCPVSLCCTTVVYVSMTVFVLFCTQYILWSIYICRYVCFYLSLIMLGNTYRPQATKVRQPINHSITVCFYKTRLRGSNLGLPKGGWGVQICQPPQPAMPFTCNSPPPPSPLEVTHGQRSDGQGTQMRK